MDRATLVGGVGLSRICFSKSYDNLGNLYLVDGDTFKFFYGTFIVLQL